MCAIFGTIGVANLKLIKEISQKQIYRGPDEQDFYVSEDNLVCLGNNRLSVIDKEKGKQPMHSLNKRFIIVFNGCIYNFLEIQKYLKKKGVNFFTNSDTEVLLNAYIYFGKKAFNYFDGMWAVAIYDKDKKDVILSRDYVGQKPLYYSKGSNYYLFSSQLNGLTLDEKISKKISRNNIKKFFSYSFVPAPQTIFENIFQVEAGENIIINAKNLKADKQKYWDLANGPDYNIFIDKIKENNFINDFNSIVKQHSIADKKPAISLSGGVDSNIIMNNFSSIEDKYSSFTLGFQNETFDEAKYVKEINNNIDKKIYYADKESFKNSFLEISKLFNEPMGDSSIIPTYIIQKKIKNYSNVSIGGDGGDESFFGYITFDAFYLAKFFKKIVPFFILNILKRFSNILKGSSDYITFKAKLKKFLGSINLEEKYLLPSWMSCLDKKNLKILLGENNKNDIFFEEMDLLFSKKNHFMRNAQIYHFKFYLPIILSKIDQASMFNSIESRSPFLSKKIINFSLENDTDKFYSLSNKKKFLKKIFKKIIPKNVLNRKKHGFAFPKEVLLKDKEFIDQFIDYNLLLNKNFFIEKYNNFINKNEDNSQYIWNELMLNISLQNLNVSKIS